MHSGLRPLNARTMPSAVANSAFVTTIFMLVICPEVRLIAAYLSGYRLSKSVPYYKPKYPGTGQCIPLDMQKRVCDNTPETFRKGHCMEIWVTPGMEA